MKEEPEKSTVDLPIEASSNEDANTTKDTKENENKTPTKQVQIDEDKNDEKTYR